ncbi:MAG: TonB-dependent receptor [Acidobacteriota bacterium]|nr:TonB-dependent receptor [Acidobacteriota bacterium]
MKRLAILFAALFLSAINVFGQQQTNGTIRGRVVDVNEAVIVGANVSVTGADGAARNVQTNQSGEFSVTVAPGKYTVRVTSPGFAVYENADVNIVAGRGAALEVTLGVTIEETQVTVGEEAAINTDPETNASAIVLKESDIEALPDNEAELEAALRALAGPSTGPNGGEIFIDGFSGGRLPPRDTIREIRINQNPFSSEYDRLGFGRIDILTKPGTDDFKGEFEFEFEDESFNSRNPFAPNRAPFQTRGLSFNLGGPLVKKRASFFVDFERENTDNNALINAQVLDPNLNVTPFQLAVLTPSKGIEFSPRFDFQLNENNTLVARYFFERSDSENDGLGGFDLLSRAFSTRDTEHTFRLTETAVISGTIINEARFQYIRRRNSQESADNSPTIRVLDAFTGGGAGFGFAFADTDRFELQNYTSFTRGGHALKFGARWRHARLENSSPANFAGTFTFTSLEQYRDTIRNLPNATPSQFSIAGGNPEAGIRQTDLGLFFQDDWRVRPDLTLSFGLRYENQTNISSHFNLAPRFGFAYAPGAGGGQNRPKTVFRGGFGIFYDRFGESLSLQAIRFNGVNQQQFVVTDPAILDAIIFTPNGVSNVPTVAQLAAFAQLQTTRVVAPDLQAPYTMQSAVGIERQLPLKTTFSATFVNAQTRRLLRSRNVNAPVNGVRPNPSAGNVFQYESTGRFNQSQLIFNSRSNFIDGVSLFANYAFGKARSDSDGAGTFPAYSYDLSGEYGDALLDIRHRFVIGGNFEAPFGIELSPFITFRSGAPFNITTGADTNGDTLFTERPAFATDLNRQCNFGTAANPVIRSCVVQTEFGNFDLQPVAGQAIIPRNYGRGPEFFVVNLRATKEFGFGGGEKKGASNQGGGGGSGRGGINSPFGGGGGGQRGGGEDDESKYNLEFSVQIRNLFNRTNGGTPVGNLRSQFFGQPVSLAGGFGFGGGGSQAAGNRRIEFEIEFSF